MIHIFKRQTKSLGKLGCVAQNKNISNSKFSTVPSDKDKVLTSIDPDREKFDNFLKNVAIYEEQQDDNLHPYFMSSDRIEGFATAKGTSKYAQRNDDEIPADNFRNPFNSDLKLSSLGIGTYVGPPDDKTDYLMYNGIKTSVLSGGVNVIDTAINYRYQKSERTVGAVLKSLTSKYGYNRDEFFISSKGGFVSDDADQGIPGRVTVEDLIKEGDMNKSDVIKENIHCIHPKFLETQLEQSLNNMNLETLDLYYLHNAYEMQGPNNTDNVVMDRLAAAFEFLEQSVQNGKIKNYGLATWLCFRAKSSEEKIYLNLQKVVELAEKVGGKNHNFKYIQVPVNVMMPEAFIEPWQDFEEDRKGEKIATKQILVAACNMLNMNLVSSQPLFQGKMAQLNLPNKMNVFNTASRHLQLIRSIPTRCLITTLVGMKDTRHVKYNLEVVKKSPMNREDWFEVLQPKRRVEHVDEEVE
jgi:aryl-alcohol dehydrogenase-like predicted oxidoreductase